MSETNTNPVTKRRDDNGIYKCPYCGEIITFTGQYCGAEFSTLFGLNMHIRKKGIAHHPPSTRVSVREASARYYEKNREEILRKAHLKHKKKKEEEK